MSDDEVDCIVVRCGKCRRAVILSVNDGAMDDAFKREIGDSVNAGCTVEHMNVIETRKQDFGCHCKKS